LPLISDSTWELHKQFGAWGEKNNYGKIVTWVIRSTFLLDQEGNTIKERKNIKATWHAERVLTYIKEELK
jgi:peroxiredoxin Q/BCP